MPNPQNIINKGFDKNPQNINKKGRPLKIYSIIKELGYSKDDLKTVFAELPFYTIAELTEISKKKNTPAIVIVVAMAFKSAIEKNDYSKIKEIIEHTIGKPLQQKEVSQTTELTLSEQLNKVKKISFIDNSVNEDEI